MCSTKLLAVVQREKDLSWNSPVLDQVKEEGNDEATLARYVIDVAVGLTDAELESFYRLLHDPSEDQADHVQIAETTALPVPRSQTRRATRPVVFQGLGFPKMLNDPGASSPDGSL